MRDRNNSCRQNILSLKLDIVKQYSKIYFTAITVALLLLFSAANAMELQSFEVNLNGEQVDVKWITNTANSGFFTLERATDGDNFEAVITSVAGTANMLVEYFEVDFNPQRGISYYRLKQTDGEGNVSYSGIVPVEYTESGEPGMGIFPNSGNNDDMATALEEIKGKEVAVKLREKGGEEVFSDIVIEETGKQLVGRDPAGELNPGAYLIIASSENILYSRKLIVK